MKDVGLLRVEKKKGRKKVDLVMLATHVTKTNNSLKSDKYITAISIT